MRVECCGFMVTTDNIGNFGESNDPKVPCWIGRITERLGECGVKQRRQLE